MAQLNPAGSERVVEGRPPFSVVIGNAHHVRITYDDRPVDLTPHIRVEVARFTLD
jgi:cytoskeleton protein RodZ